MFFFFVQAVMPGIILLAGGTQFRWAMFESYQPVPRFFVESAEGESATELSELVVRARGDVDYAAVVPPYLCTTRPRTISVRTEVAGISIGIYRCSAAD